MGLELRAFSELVLADEDDYTLDDNGYIEDDGYWDNNGRYIRHFVITSPALEERFAGLQSPLEIGECYRIEGDCEWLAWSANYSDFNEWRCFLHDFAEENGLNKEYCWLYDLPDCSALIGPDVSALLADVFHGNYDTYQEYVDTVEEDDDVLAEQYRLAYDAFMEAFDIARDGGAVEFC